MTDRTIVRLRYVIQEQELQLLLRSFPKVKRIVALARPVGDERSDTVACWVSGSALARVERLWRGIVPGCHQSVSVGNDFGDDVEYCVKRVWSGGRRWDGSVVEDGE